MKCFVFRIKNREFSSRPVSKKERKNVRTPKSPHTRLSLPPSDDSCHRKRDYAQANQCKTNRQQKEMLMQHSLPVDIRPAHRFCDQAACARAGQCHCRDIENSVCHYLFLLSTHPSIVRFCLKERKQSLQYPFPETLASIFREMHVHIF